MFENTTQVFWELRKCTNMQWYSEIKFWDSEMAFYSHSGLEIALKYYAQRFIPY